MRIAFAGSHRTGKTTLLEAVADELPAYTAIDEPYRILEDEGHDFADPPTPGDFEHQLRCSLDLLAEHGDNVLFDRCPIDFVAYLHALGEDADIDEEPLRAAIGSLDLLVLVPIEEPDRIALPRHEDRALRADVDEILRRLLVDDRFAFGVRVVEVRGDVGTRVAQVLAELR